MSYSVDKVFIRLNSENMSDLEVMISDKLMDCAWEEVLGHETICHVISLMRDNIDINITGDGKIIPSSNSSNLTNNQLSRLMFYAGIASLQLYVFENFLGHCIDDAVENEGLRILKEMYHGKMSELSSDGENMYSLVRHPYLFHFAHSVLNNPSQDVLKEHELIVHIWKLRVAIIHQLSLTASSGTLYESIKSTSNSLIALIQTEPYTLTKEVRVQQLIEISMCFLAYKDADHSKKYLKEATKLSGLNIKLSGALGVRTFFQQKPTSQLVVHFDRNGLVDAETQATHDGDLSSTCNDNPKLLPRNVTLSDDTLLPKVKFVVSNDNLNEIENDIGKSDNDNECFKLTPSEQCLILALISNSYLIGSKDDELSREELLAYIEYLIPKTRVWCIHYKALMIRSLLEKEKTRKVDRSMTQMNELVDEVVKEMNQVNADANELKRVRCENFYSIQLTPFWITEKYLAEILISLGAIKSALDIYLRIQLWDEIISCYQSLSRLDKAEALIRERLLVEETPLLYCLLGDVTENIECYHKAWQMSNERYHRAQKALGNHYFKLKDYKQSIEHMQASLNINSMQLDAWYRLSFAALILEDYELAAKGYRRVVQMDSSSYEAWNNLSKVYIKLNQKERAWKTLQESLRNNYEEWRIWENYLVVSVDVGAFFEVIQSWHRLIEIKGKYEDDHVLDILVNAICGDIIDINGEPASKLAPKVQELMGRVASITSGSSQFWRLYARLLMNNHKQLEDYEKVIQCLQKSHRALVQTNKWEKDVSMISNVLEQSSCLVDEYLKCLDLMKHDKVRCHQLLGAFKMSFNSMLTIITNNSFIWDIDECEKREHIKSLMEVCRNKLDMMMDLLVKLSE